MTARCPYMHTGEGLHRSVDPTDGPTYLYTQCAAADARRVFACFEQPDLKAPVHLGRDRPGRVAAGLQQPDARADGGRAAASRRWVFAADAAAAHLPCRPVRRAVPRRALGVRPGRTAPIRWGCSPGPRWPSTWTPTEILEITRAGLAHYEREFVVPYPFGKYDQVFVPEFNFGAHGEPGSGHVPRGRLPVPVPGHRGRPRDPGDGDLPRDGAHVVRRPRHDALVGRPVAQRVVRELGRLRRGRVGHAVHRRMDRPSPWRRRRGPTSRTSCPRPTRWSPTSRTSRPSTSSFDGITYAKGASVLKQLVAYVGYDAFLAGLNALLRAACLGQRDPGRPPDRAGAGQRPRPAGVGPGMAAGARGHHARGAGGPRRGWALRVRADRPAARHATGRRQPGAAPTSGGRRAVPLDRRRRGAPAGARRPGGDRRAGGRGRGRRARGGAGRRPAPGQRRRPHLRQGAPGPGQHGDGSGGRGGVGRLPAQGRGLGGPVGAGARSRDAGAGLHRRGPGRARSTSPGRASSTPSGG